MLEDGAGGEVGQEAFEDDQVGGDQELGVAEAEVGVVDPVEVRPGHQQAHDLGLAGAGCELEAELGPRVALGGALEVGKSSKLLDAAGACDLVEEDRRFDRAALVGIPKEEGAVRSEVRFGEPVVEEGVGEVGGAGVAGLDPGGDASLDGADQLLLRVDRGKEALGARSAAGHGGRLLSRRGRGRP